MSSALPAASEPAFAPLPIDGSRGLPQAFSFSFDGVLYHFRLHVNLAAEELATGAEAYALPTPAGGHLAVRVEQEGPGGTRQTIFQRKVVPGLVYTAGAIRLTFPEQLVARQNVNGRGEAGSRLSGGIARRWA